MVRKSESLISSAFAASAAFLCAACKCCSLSEFDIDVPGIGSDIDYLLYSAPFSSAFYRNRSYTSLYPPVAYRTLRRVRGRWPAHPGNACGLVRSWRPPPLERWNSSAPPRRNRVKCEGLQRLAQLPRIIQPVEEVSTQLIATIDRARMARESAYLVPILGVKALEGGVLHNLPAFRANTCLWQARDRREEWP